MGIVGQHDNGPDLFVAHYRADARAPGLFHAEKSLAAIDRLGDIVVVAVDAAIGRVGCADAGGQERDVPLVVSRGGKTLDEMPLQVKRFVVGRSILQRHLAR